MSEYTVNDWAVFKHPSTGEPIMPSGTGVPDDPPGRHRRARHQFFRFSGLKIDERLAEMDGVEEQIAYLLFVLYDAIERQILRESREADEFIKSLRHKLRERYQHKLRALKSNTEDPVEERIRRLKSAQAAERQRTHADASPEVERFIGHVESEIELLQLQPANEGEAKRAGGGANQKGRPGRQTVLNDPGAYPEVMLQAVLDWTDDDSNRGKPFRSTISEDSLCGFVAQRVGEKARYSPVQDTIKARLESVMRELGVDLPYGPTNKRSYFEMRGDIEEAAKEKGLICRD